MEDMKQQANPGIELSDRVQWQHAQSNESVRRDSRTGDLRLAVFASGSSLLEDDAFLSATRFTYEFNWAPVILLLVLFASMTWLLVIDTSVWAIIAPICLCSAWIALVYRKPRNCLKPATIWVNKWLCSCWCCTAGPGGHTRDDHRQGLLKVDEGTTTQSAAAAAHPSAPGARLHHNFRYASQFDRALSIENEDLLSLPNFSGWIIGGFVGLCVLTIAAHIVNEYSGAFSPGSHNRHILLQCRIVDAGDEVKVSRACFVEEVYALPYILYFSVNLFVVVCTGWERSKRTTAIIQSEARRLVRKHTQDPTVRVREEENERDAVRRARGEESERGAGGAASRAYEEDINRWLYKRLPNDLYEQAGDGHVKKCHCHEGNTHYTHSNRAVGVLPLIWDVDYVRPGHVQEPDAKKCPRKHNVDVAEVACHRHVKEAALPAELKEASRERTNTTTPLTACKGCPLECKLARRACCRTGGGASDGEDCARLPGMFPDNQHCPRHERERVECQCECDHSKCNRESGQQCVCYGRHGSHGRLRREIVPVSLCARVVYMVCAILLSLIYLITQPSFRHHHRAKWYDWLLYCGSLPLSISAIYFAFVFLRSVGLLYSENVATLRLVGHHVHRSVGRAPASAVGTAIPSNMDSSRRRRQSHSSDKAGDDELCKCYIKQLKAWWFLRKFALNFKCKLNFDLGRWGFALELVVATIMLLAIVLTVMYLPIADVATVMFIVPAILCAVLIGSMLLHLINAVNFFQLQQQHAELLRQRKLELSLKSDWECLSSGEGGQQERVITLIDNMIELIRAEKPPKIFGIALKPAFLTSVQGYVFASISVIVGKLSHDLLVNA